MPRHLAARLLVCALEGGKRTSSARLTTLLPSPTTRFVLPQSLSCPINTSALSQPRTPDCSPLITLSHTSPRRPRFHPQQQQVSLCFLLIRPAPSPRPSPTAPPINSDVPPDRTHWAMTHDGSFRCASRESFVFTNQIGPFLPATRALLQVLNNTSLPRHLHVDDDHMKIRRDTKRIPSKDI